MTTFCGRQNENIKAAYENFKDENTYLIDSYLWNIPNESDNLHPDVDGHKMITEKLSEEITRILNTTPEPEATPVPIEAPSQPKKTN